MSGTAVVVDVSPVGLVVNDGDVRAKDTMQTRLADMPDGTHLLVATAAFRNEPFSW